MPNLPTTGSPDPSWQLPQQTAPASPPPASQPPVRRSRKALWIVFFLLLLAGLGGAGYWYLQPERVLQRVVTKVGLVDTMSFTSTTRVTIAPETLSPALLSQKPLTVPQVLGISTAQAQELAPTPSSEETKFTVTVDGSMDTTSAEVEKWAFKFGFAMSNDSSMNASFDFMSIGDVIYVKLNTIPSAAMAFVDTSLFTNKWIEIDLLALAKKYDWEKEYQEYKDAGKLTPEQEAKLEELFKAADFLDIVSVLSTNLLTTDPSSEYKVRIDENELRRFAAEVVRELDLPESAAEAEAAVDSSISEFDGLSMFVTVNPFTATPRSTVAEYIDPNGGGNSRSELRITSFGEPVSITAPTGAVPVEQFLEEIEKQYTESLGEAGLVPLESSEGQIFETL